MTVREAIESALNLIPDDREASEVLVVWKEDGTYHLQVKSASHKTLTLTTEGLKIEDRKL